MHTVSSLNEYIRLKLEFDENLTNIEVKGEISGIKVYSSGHIYFTLKDEHSQVSAVIFNGVDKDIKIKEGQGIIAQGSVKVYKPKGAYKLIIEKIEMLGKGDLYKRFLSLKAELKAKGYFDKTKRRLPKIPKSVGIVTSKEGAVIKDLIVNITRRFPGLELKIYSVQVQGENAKYEISKAINTLDNLNLDLIVIARGGGSLEDLWAFNEMIVLKSIYNSKTPIVSAVGHETDFVLSDFVADLRAPTPSTAAELIVPDKETIINQIKAHIEDMKRIIKNNLEIRMLRIKNLLNKNLINIILNKVDNYNIVLDNINYKAISLAKSFLEKAEYKLDKISLRLEAKNIKKQLKQGFAIVSVDDKIIKSFAEAKKYKKLAINFYDGHMKTKVDRYGV